MTKEEIRIEADKYNRSLSRHPTSVQELTEVLVEFAERMQLLQQTLCKTLLPSLEDAWNAGVDEGGERTGNFEWGIRRKNIEFSEWYESELKNNSSGQ